MKEKDLEKNLDNLIIDGLIKEAEQDNKDFEIAMRNMSDEDFLGLIYDAVPAEKEPTHEYDDSLRFSSVDEIANENSSSVGLEVPHVSSNMNHPHVYRRYSLDKEIVSSDAAYIPDKDKADKSEGGKKWLPWLAAAVSAVAIVIAILIPAFSRMDSRACENALFAMNTYLPSSKGSDLSSESIDELKRMLPELETAYNKSLKNGEGIKYAEGPKLSEEDALDYYSPTPRDAAWDLVEAYLLLGEKKKAVQLLKTLADKYGDTEDGNFCRHLITTLN